MVFTILIDNCKVFFLFICKIFTYIKYILSHFILLKHMNTLTLKLDI